MMVYIDIETKNILLFGDDDVKNIPFSEVNDIDTYLEGKNAYYITNVIEVNSKDIINLISSIDGVEYSKPKQIFSLSDINNDNLYIHANIEQNIFIPDIALKFEGKFDCKIINDDIRKMIKISPTLQSLIKNGKIEIINEQCRNKMLREGKKKQVKFNKRQEEIDKSLDSILVERNTDGDFDSFVDKTHPGAIEVDIMSRGEGPETMSENISYLDGEA